MLFTYSILGSQVRERLSSSLTLPGISNTLQNYQMPWRSALDDLHVPRGLDATYKRILISIPEEHKHREKKALLLLAGGKLSFERPRFIVIARAIIVDIDTKSFDPSDHILEPEEFITETCTCLVRVQRIHGYYSLTTP
ncbi:hypothetical protein B0H66DRAFT_587848 [Apodospora peruviana]|uniref:Uncharacterized protein n=1 Tax=Apodospora peruviana TaxID=516989 RepID=A0AAE0MBI8_9PEZI|nr:hypothetical protein B0H66DRAFT_587848 [Apodospora peruviana]